MASFASMMLVAMSFFGCATARLENVTAGELERRLAAMDDAPGVVVGAVWRDGTRIVRTAGLADVASGKPVLRSTPFAWFSITKLFTATAILRLVEAKRVDLDAPVSRYLPEVRVARRVKEATVRHLLAHAAGLRNPIPVSWVHLTKEPTPPLADVVRQRVGETPDLAFEPGAKSAYSNLGYLLLGLIVERVSGEPFQDHVASDVLRPLGCKGTAFAGTAERATGYQRRWSFMGLAASWMLDDRFFEGSAGPYRALRSFEVDGASYGGLSGPVDDLLTFAEMVLAKGQTPTGVFLSETTMAEALAPFVAATGEAEEIALGWHLGRIGEEPFVYHLGGGGGFRSELRVYPKLGYAVVVLANETSFPTGKWARLVVR